MARERRKNLKHEDLGGLKYFKVLATDRLEVSPETVSTIYQKRWAIEIFFRFFKHILGCRHLISHSQNGLQLQLYIAIIACLLIAIWTGLSPNKTILRLVEFHLMGWADESEISTQALSARILAPYRTIFNKNQP